jgi:hypothetical protein
LTQLPLLFVQNPADEFGLRDVDADPNPQVHKLKEPLNKN